MTSPTSSPFPRLQDAVAEGRLANVFFRRDQLRRLHEALVRQKDALLVAAVHDGGSTASEALAELYLTLTAVKQYHDGLVPAGPAGEIAAEYRIAQGQDAADANVAVGIVLLVPQRHTLLYSAVVPLAAAVAAGNCVVVVMPQTLQSLPPLLSGLLGEAVDGDIHAVVPTRPADVPARHCIQVIQTGNAAAHDDDHDHSDHGDHGDHGPRTLFSPTRALVVAIVDRTADLDQAARCLVDARLQFGGRSPYAPDVVLVNEFAKQDFLRAAVQHWIRYTTDDGKNGKIGKNGKPRQDEPGKAAAAAQNASIRTITSGSDSRIADVLDRSALPSLGKIAQRTLHVHAVRSLDDAVELVADLAPQQPPLAVYAFGDLPSCKYLLQFTSPQAGFANRIPPELLNHALSLATRYPPSLFSVPRPKFAETSALSRELAIILDGPLPPTAAAEAKLLRKVQVEPRAPVRLITGYFEMSALVGFLTRVAVVGALTCYAVVKLRK